MHASTLSLATSIPTTTSSFCAIIQLPSLLGSGSKPVQLFGFKEDTGSVPRSPTGSRPLSTNGIRSSDGRLVRTARSHILADFADTRARHKPLKPLRAGMPGDFRCDRCEYSCASLRHHAHTRLRVHWAP